jgi:hypothetical protein
MPMAHVALTQSPKPGARATASTPALTRQGRAERLRRARAAAQLLRAAFPKVEQLRIELKFEDPSSISPTPQAHVLYPPAPAFFTYRCPHSDCDGEFVLEDAVRKAMSDSARAAQGLLLCGGARTGEQGSKRPCELRLAYAVSAQYHSDT